MSDAKLSHVVSYYTDNINLIIEQFSKEHYDFKLIESTFESIVFKFGNALSKYNIKNPYKKAHNHLLKLIQIKLNKTNLKINIYDFFPECKSIYVIQMV